MKKYFKTPFYNDLMQVFITCITIIIASKLTGGLAMVIVAAMAVNEAFKGHIGKGIFYSAFIFFACGANRLIIPLPPPFFLAIRIVPILMVIALSSKASNRHQVPIGGIFGYLGCAVISSIFGYNAGVSLFKLANFLFFISTIYCASAALKNQKDIYFVRCGFAVLSGIVIAGTLFLIVFAPGMAHNAGRDGGLLCGVMGQSQALAPSLVCSAAWVVCDMLMVEKKFNRFHVALLIIAPFLMFYSRSRTAFLAFSLFIISFLLYTFNKIKVTSKIKNKLRKGITVAIAAMVIGGIIAEVRSNAISRWLRKTDNVEEDERSLEDAFTGSRQGLVQVSLADFKQNPIFGKGFQVSYWLQWVKVGILGPKDPVSVEKGVLPVMILGEGGIVGAIAFLAFLISFTTTCAQKRYFATMIVFYAFLFTNLSEATIFSPTGPGGNLWYFSTLGAFSIDLSVIMGNPNGSISKRRLPPFQLTPKPKNNLNPTEGVNNDTTKT